MSIYSYPSDIVIHVKNVIEEINANWNLVSFDQATSAYFVNLVNNTTMNLFIFELELLTNSFTEWNKIEYFTEKSYADLFQELPKLDIIPTTLKEKTTNLIMNYFFKLSEYLEKLTGTLDEAFTHNYGKNDLFLFFFKALEKNISKENVSSEWISSKTTMVTKT